MNRKKNITVKQVQDSEGKPFAIPDIEHKPEVDEDPWGDDGLTHKQRIFVKAYIGPAAGNATIAAGIAGYCPNNHSSQKNTACQLLRKPNVHAAIAQALASRFGSPEWIRNNLIDIASSSFANFIDIDNDGNTKINFVRAAEAGALGQIKEYSEEVLKVSGVEAVTVKRSIKLHDKRAALETLARIDGKLNKFTIALTGPNGGPIQTETTHKFDYEQYRDMFARSRSTVRNGEGTASPNSN